MQEIPPNTSKLKTYNDAYFSSLVFLLVTLDMKCFTKLCIFHCLYHSDRLHKVKHAKTHAHKDIYIYTWMYTRTHASTHACVHTCTQTTATDRSQDRQVKWRQTTPVYSLAPIFTCLAMTPNLLAKPALLSLLSLQPLSQNCHTQSLILTIHTKYWNRVSLSPKPSGRISYITNRCKMASTMQSHLA